MRNKNSIEILKALRGHDTIVWFTCKRYEKMLFLEIY